MKIAYFDCSSGVAGDMLLASLIDAGLPVRPLDAALRRVARRAGWKIDVSRIRRGHSFARRLDVTGTVAFDSPFQMRRCIERAPLSDAARKDSLAVLDTLIRAESRVHGVPSSRVHFHELNSIDTLVDIAGFCIAMEQLGIDRVIASPVNVGAPAPATLEIIKSRKVPVYSADARYETATPTGTAILATLATFGPMPALTVLSSGRGAGMREFENASNVLQSVIGVTPEKEYERDEAVLLETNIDDMDPRIYPYLVEKLLAEGAFDAWMQQIIMKKGRPGIIFSVLAPVKKEKLLLDILFAETTTLGIRRFPLSRYLLHRTAQGDRKIAHLPRGGKKRMVEFEKAKRKALITGRPLSEYLIP